jgi:hypothetical protein
MTTRGDVESSLPNSAAAVEIAGAAGVAREQTIATDATR